MIHSSKKFYRKLLVIMAKDPVPGEVKTRLTPPLSPYDVADLYRCFLQDRVQEMKPLEGIDLALAYTPEHAKSRFASIIPDKFKLVAQHGKNLSEKLINIFEEKLSEGYHAVSVVDTDTPDVTRSIITSSFHVLLFEKKDVVFGPCNDGGYFLIGMKKTFPELFQKIPWSSENVLAISMRRAKKLGLKIALLPCFNDIDTYEDLLEFYHRYKDRKSDENWAGKKTITFLKNKFKPTPFR